MEMISAISYNVRVSPAGESALANAPINTLVMVIRKRKKKKKSNQNKTTNSLCKSWPAETLSVKGRQ